jgi:hypothetical protein
MGPVSMRTRQRDKEAQLRRVLEHLATGAAQPPKLGRGDDRGFANLRRPPIEIPRATKNALRRRGWAVDGPEGRLVITEAGRDELEAGG